MRRKKDMPKRHLAILEHEKRVWLAFSLKMMDDDIADLPPLKKPQGDAIALQEFFESFAFESLYSSVNELTG